MANRVWQHLIGEGIVRTPEDFGVTGSRPTHPELLDYLALRLIENQWSIKALITEIATSQTYQIGWQVDSVAREKDPENLYLWRSHPQRLAAETLRDSLLWVGGSLQLERPHGSLVAQAGPFEIGRGQQAAQLIRIAAAGNAANRSADEGSMMETMNASPSESQRPLANALRRREMAGGGGPTITETAVNRPTNYRSVYLPIVRDLLPRALDLFDVAEPSMVIGVREQSNTAPQALYMMNNSWVQQQAEQLAEQALSRSLSSSQAIDYIFKAAYSRGPTSLEMEQCLSYLSQLTDQFAAQAAEEQARARAEQQRRQRRDAARRRARGGRGEGRRDTPPESPAADADTTTDADPTDPVAEEVSRQVLGVLCHAILATAEFRYRN
jgi:hypothetical protein